MRATEGSRDVRDGSDPLPFFPAVAAARRSPRLALPRVRSDGRLVGASGDAPGEQKVPWWTPLPGPPAARPGPGEGGRRPGTGGPAERWLRPGNALGPHPVAGAGRVPFNRFFGWIAPVLSRVADG